MSKQDSNLTQDVLKEHLSYDPDTGIFTRKKGWSSFRVGDIAGSPNDQGYIHIFILSRLRKAHRLAWLYVHGEWPADQIDHINGNRSDNRICNLRNVSHSGNAQNQRLAPKNNASGYLGVTKRNSKWEARIRVDKKYKYLGVFETPQEAHEKYLQAKRMFHSTCTI